MTGQFTNIWRKIVCIRIDNFWSYFMIIADWCYIPQHYAALEGHKFLRDPVWCKDSLTIYHNYQLVSCILNFSLLNHLADCMDSSHVSSMKHATRNCLPFPINKWRHRSPSQYRLLARSSSMASFTCLKGTIHKERPHPERGVGLVQKQT